MKDLTLSKEDQGVAKSTARAFCEASRNSGCEVRIECTSEKQRELINHIWCLPINKEDFFPHPTIPYQFEFLNGSCICLNLKEASCKEDA